MVQNIYAEAQSVVAEIEDGHAELERLVALNINNQVKVYPEFIYFCKDK